MRLFRVSSQTATERTGFLVLCIAALLMLPQSTFLYAQAPNPQSPSEVAVQRDAAGVAAILAAIQALGGKQRIDAVENCTATGTVNESGQTDSFTWSNAGEEFRYEYSSGTVIASGHGNGKAQFDGHSHKLPVEARDIQLPIHLPAMKLDHLASRLDVSVSFHGSSIVNGISVVAVETRIQTTTRLRTSSKEVWYFNPQDGMPVAVDFFSPNLQDPRSGEMTRATFGNFQTIQQIRVPFLIQLQSVDNQAASIEFVLLLRPLWVRPTLRSIRPCA